MVVMLAVADVGVGCHERSIGLGVCLVEINGLICVWKL